jgi:hypothetical protein
MKPFRYIPLVQGDSIHQSGWLKKNGFTKDSPYIFPNEIDAIIDGVRKTPTMFMPYAIRSGKTIRVSHPTKTHSFRVAYTDRSEEVVIIALIHPNRKPNYWINRKF